jgi:hypothetical protein
VKDFSRLDERFRLPTRTWDQLPEFQRFGFAVFKLKSGTRKYHPMAFKFERSDATKLFFPTVHIHDGKFHMTATFDHEVYCQAPNALNVLNWQESRGHAGQFANIALSKGILEPKEHCYKKVLKGRLANRDIYLARV